MPGIEKKQRKNKHRAGKKVRVRYECAIARTLLAQYKEVVVQTAININPISEIVEKEDNLNFEELIKSLEELINSD